MLNIITSRNAGFNLVHTSFLTFSEAWSWHESDTALWEDVDDDSEGVEMRSWISASLGTALTSDFCQCAVVVGFWRC